MATEEERKRLEAAKLHSQGIRPSEIARRLGRSRQWVYKWIGRCKEGGEDWNVSQSTAPHDAPSRLCRTTEDLVVETRLALESDPHRESGAYAIWHCLKNHGVSPPSVASINRIISRNGLVKRKQAYVKSGIDYPESPLNMHIMDLVGPCHLRGGPRFYLLDVISNDTRHAGVFPMLAKDALSITQSLIKFFKRYTVPDWLQMDNELTFKGSNRHPRSLGLLLRTLLDLNVRPRFIPVGEPWRNGVIERFNQKVEKTLMTQPHSNFEELVRHADEFSATHNATHSYSTLGHRTPEELDLELDVPMCPLNPSYEVGKKPIIDPHNLNEIEFVRLVRSDLNINVFNTEINVPPQLMHTYVLATVLVNEHMVLIKQDNNLVQAVPFAMPLI